MVKKKRTLRLSKAERARRRKQARKNFGHIKTRTKVRSKLKIKRRRSSPMARRKKSKVRRNKSYGLLATTVLPGFAYGAARATVSKWLAPLTAKIPGGKYADNILMGTVGWLVSKYGRVPLLKRVGKAGLLVESAFLGADVVGARVGAAATAIEQSFR